MFIGKYLSSPPTLGDGDQAIPLYDNAGNLKVSIGAAPGSGSSSVTEYTEDAAAASNPSGQMLLAVRRDTLTDSEVTNDGDNIALKATARGELNVMAGSPATIITVNPTVETTALDAGDVTFDTTIITGAARLSGSITCLNTVIIIDKADQKAELNLVFLSANTSLGTLDSAPDIDDTEVLDVVGILNVPSTAYVDLGGASVATVRDVNLMMKTVGSANLYVAAFCVGTPNYASATALRLLFGFVQA